MTENSIAAMNAEERRQFVIKGQAAKAAKVAARRVSPLRRDFADEPLWLELARDYGVRLPPWGESIKRAVQSKFLHGIGRSWGWYYAEANERAGEFEARNPTWPARAWAGVVLELHHRLVVVSDKTAA